MPIHQNQNIIFRVCSLTVLTSLLCQNGLLVESRVADSRQGGGLVPEDKNVILQSPMVTNWGEWGEFSYCEDNMYVMGMRLKTEPVQGPGDDTSLNGVSFMCGNKGDPPKLLHSERRQIKSSVGHWGTWGVSYECPGSYAVGFQLRSEVGQNNHDDTAANNLRLYCQNTVGGNRIYLEGSGLNWGDWTDPQFCKPGHAICGLQTQVEHPRGHKVDDSSLNNIKVSCCPVPPK